MKHIHGLTAFSSKYIPYFQGDSQQSQLEKNHFIHGLRIKSDECEQIGRLLEENTLEIVAAPEKTIKEGEINLFHCFIQAGLLTPIAKEAHSEVLTCHIANPTAKNILHRLHKKWQIQNMNRATLIFDIDNVLAMHDACTLQTILFFLRQGAVITAYGVTHYIQSKDKKNLSKQLFSLQFTSTQIQNQESPTCVPCWEQPKKSLAIYEKGLHLLQQFNPDLALITSARYRDCIANPATENQQTEILDAQKHEHVACLLM